MGIRKRSARYATWLFAAGLMLNLAGIAGLTAGASPAVAAPGSTTTTTNPHEDTDTDPGDAPPPGPTTTAPTTAPTTTPPSTTTPTTTAPTTIAPSSGSSAQVGSVTPTHSTTSATTVAPAVSAAASTAGGAHQGTGTLAFTGRDLSATALVGGVMIASGLGVITLSKRRRASRR